MSQGHIESIYNLIPKEEIKPPKPPMYRSKHNPGKPVTGSTFGCTGSTRIIGAGSGDKISKGKLKDKLSDKAEEKAAAKSTLSRRPSVPKRDDSPIMGLKTNKNFVVANSVEAILTEPKNVGSKDVDWTKKPDYGKVPSYLNKVKDEINREKDMIDAFVKAQLGQEEVVQEQGTVMSEKERQELIRALKTKWDERNAQYQKICHQTQLDTHGKKLRKQNLENELDQLEKDIQMLENSSGVVIKN